MLQALRSPYCLILAQETGRVNITQLAKEYGQRLCTALMSLHAFTHCDTTSAFKGIGKVRPIKLLKRTARFQDVLCQVGESWHPSDDLENHLEEFTCAMYGKPRYASVDALRFTALKDKCGGPDSHINFDRNIDLSKLPPCREALRQHIRRVNFQVGIWKAANIPQPLIPEATERHGWKMLHGKLEPNWFNGPLIPAGVAEDNSVESDDNRSFSDDESDEDDVVSDDAVSDSETDED